MSPSYGLNSITDAVLRMVLALDNPQKVDMPLNQRKKPDLIEIYGFDLFSKD